jgi:transposase
MARLPRGADNLDWAQEVLAQAQTIEQLRQAQAVVLPIKFGLSLEQTAQIIGRSKHWTCTLRNRFLAGEIVGDGQRAPRGTQARRVRAFEQEREALKPFLERAAQGGVLVVKQIKPELEARLGRTLALSTVYALLHRHGWRKLAPDKRHPKSDPQAQEEWKKNSQSD